MYAVRYYTLKRFIHNGVYRMLKPKSSQLSFYGDHIYDRVIPDDHFLKQLDKAIYTAPH